jgi:mannose-6-phosphate isomerase-like protein (cupin superfamily)
MLSSIVVLLLSAAPAPADPATVVPSAATVQVTVTDRRGSPLRSARVAVAGASEREGTTDAKGRVVFRNVLPGDYMLEVQRDAFITFQKEFTVAPGRDAVSVAAALSPTSSIPSRPARGTSKPIGASSTPQIVSISEPAKRELVEPDDVRETLIGASSTPQNVSIPDLTKQDLLGQDDVKETRIGCSGSTGPRLIQVAEAPGAPVLTTAEEMLYVVEGEATLSVDGRSEPVKSGSLSIIPRETTYSLSRKGREPVVVLSVVGGRSCAGAPLTFTPR